MAKGLLKNYTFVTASKTITLTDITTVRLDKLALITDVTTNKILYNFADLTVSTATVATNVITLSVLQGGEAGTDKLRIDYDVESSDTSAFADTTQPVSGTVSITSNSAVNVAQINGVTPLMGNGITGTGSQRVTIASDNTAFSVNNTQQGTASENIAQVNGVTVLTGTGATGTGSQRTTVAVDSATVAGSATLPAGTNLIGKVGLDQTTPGTTNAISVAQIGATTVTTGVGASTAGTQRVVTATDSTIGTVTLVTQNADVRQATAANFNATVVGNKTNNNAVPGATNVGVLGSVANAATPSFTEGNLVTSSVDLSGNTRVVQSDLIVAATAITTTNLNLFSGAATANSTVASGTLNAVDTGTFQVTGTYTGVLVPQGTVDGTNWITLTTVSPLNSVNVLSSLVSGQIGIFQIDIAGLRSWRVTASTTVTGTATVTLEATTGSGMMALVGSVKLDPTTAPSVSVSGGNTSASVYNQLENSLLEQILAQLQTQNDSLGISPAGSNANLRRTLDNNFNEVITLQNDRSRIKTANITISASTAETTLINADPNNFVDILAVVVSNTSTATATRIDFRDSTGGTVIFPVYSNGGANPAGFSLGGIAIPQTMMNKNWTAQCSVSTTDIRIFVLYSLKAN